MKPTLIIGVILIVLGGAVLGYEQYTYTTKEQVFQIGTITATAEKTHTVLFPPLLGWLLVGGGALLLAIAVSIRKD
jgi:hypothetical protein